MLIKHLCQVQVLLFKMKMGKILKLMLPTLLLLLKCESATLDVNHELPDLKIDTYAFRAIDPVNVTIGQYFAIGVAQFDIQKVPADFKVYEISQEKFINMFETLEKHSSDRASEQRRQVDNNIFDCSVKNPTMEIVRTLSVYSQTPSNKFSFTSDQSIIYVAVGSRQLLYVLDTASMELQVYHFTPQRMNFLSSAKITSAKGGEKIAMATGSNEQYIYIFSTSGMWSIKTKTVLTNVEKLTEGLNGFSSASDQIDRLYHGEYGYIVALKKLNAVYLIPEDQGSATKYRRINTFGQLQLIPQDLFVDSRLLYILDLHQGVFIYHILGNGDVVEFDHIAWRSYGNIEIIVKEATIFVRYLDQEGQKIVEINYNSEKHMADLVRYYKSDQVVSAMSIQIVPVFSSQRSYTINEALLFLIAGNGEVEVYPYNVDPRVINTGHNGVKMHIEGVTKMIHLFQDLYIIATSENLIYARLRIEKPELVCTLKESTGHIYYELQFSANVSSCEAYEPTLEHKVNFNRNCQVLANYAVFVDDPDLSRFQKALLYGVVFMVVSSFIVGLLCLIQWRNSQLSLIGRIKDEIIKLRDRYRKMQPFTEDEPEHPKAVQFELPESLPIPDQIGPNQ